MFSYIFLKGMIKQFLTDVDWQDIDYLVIDTPPGTSDEHITVMENLRQFKNKGAVIVTTPQAVAIEDVRKEITFCNKTGIPILGIIENMSGYVCPFCAVSNYKEIYDNSKQIFLLITVTFRNVQIFFLLAVENHWRK